MCRKRGRSGAMTLFWCGRLLAGNWDGYPDRKVITMSWDMIYIYICIYMCVYCICIWLGEIVFIQYYPWAISWTERSYWFWSLYWIPWMIAQAWVFLHHAWHSLLSSYLNGAATDYQYMHYMPQGTNPTTRHKAWCFFWQPKPHAVPKILACFSVFCFPKQMTVL